MIAVCNPNNLTGTVLSEESIKEIVKVADRVGAWILSDEVYRGAELNGKETPSFWGKYEKVIVNGGLSKAYALPGLRIGWMVGPKKLIANSWANHDYSTIAPGVINDYLASLSLKSEMRQKILSRNRKILNKNLALVKEWLPNHADLFKLIPPCAGGIAFIHYNLDINSTQLIMKLLHKRSVFIVSGDCFGMDHFIRLGYGAEKDYLLAGLGLINETLGEIQSKG